MLVFDALGYRTFELPFVEDSLDIDRIIDVSESKRIAPNYKLIVIVGLLAYNLYVTTCSLTLRPTNGAAINPLKREQYMT